MRRNNPRLATPPTPRPSGAPSIGSIPFIIPTNLGSTDDRTVRIRIGPITNDQFVTGSFRKSPEISELESAIRSAGFYGNLTSIPFGTAGTSGPRLSRDADGMNLSYDRCQIPAARPDGSRQWQPEVVQVRWSAVTRRGTSGSGTVAHFADLEVASLWAAYALDLSTDAEKISILNSVDPASGQSGLPFFLAQHDFVFDCFHAIAQFFNSLNIPWYTHPGSRDLYRKWMAGRFSGGDSVLFNPRSDYNDQHWFTKEFLTDERNPLRLRPLLRSATADDRYGIIPREIRDAWNRFGSKPGDNDRYPIEFRQRAGIALKKLEGDWLLPDNDPPVDYQDSVLNEAFVIPFALDFNAVIQTGRKDAATLSREQAYELIGRLGGSPILDLEGATIFQSSPGFRIGRLADWRTYAWDDRVNVGIVPWQAAAPLESYLRWAQEWARLISSSDPAQILSDSRVSVIRTNWQWTEALGPEGFSRSAATADTRAEREGRGSDVLTAVSALTEAASGTIPVIGNIIGGVVSGGLNLINQFVRTGPPKSTARDDLGRWKPKFERAYLGGDPLSTVPADGVPLHKVPTLPGFCRTRRAIPPSELRPEEEEVKSPIQPHPNQPPGNPPDQDQQGISTGAKVAIGLGVAAIVGAGGYAIYLQRAKVKRRGKP